VFIRGFQGFAMALRVYSTLIRDKKDFEEVTGKIAKRGDTVSMYLCGPTVYKPSHIGHMVGPVIFDTVKRYLTYLGYKVNWVVNITDVDDKLIVRARELNTTVPELSRQMTEDYFKCLKALNVTGIDHFPRATEYIDGMIEVIQKLEEKGFAYQVDDGVYFDVSKDPDYGALSNRDPEQMEAGARLEVNARKRNPGDFALWKGAKPDEPVEVQYASPFKCGRGRPGWHIECTCMAIKMLGETLDIHGGGLDLQFPHHENELAQSESLTDRPFARFWMHNGLLKMGSAKMAGSVGNVVNIADLLKRHSAETVRFLLLSSHYRSPIEYSEERLDEIARSLEGFYRFFERYERITKQSFFSISPILADEELLRLEEGGSWWEKFAELRTRFLEHMEDDFNTAGAIGVLFDLLGELNSGATTYSMDHALAQDTEHLMLVPFRTGAYVLRELSNILGLFWELPAKQSLGGGDALVAGLMQLLLDLRNNLRAEAKTAAKDNPLKKTLFDQTDLIRTRLRELDVTLEDRPSGTTWRVG
jgi:cysteinyl-tRNA synthetase